MAAEYNYSSTAVATTLSGSMDGSTTTANVVSTSGFPAVPFKLTIDPDGAAEEIVKVTAVVGLALTVVRGWDGTVALSHSAGDAVRHQVTGEDLRLAREHEDATADVHGIGATSNVVGTLTVQTLEGKTIDSADNTLVVAQSAVTGLVAALAAKVDDSQIDSSWLTALGLPLDADAATVLGAIGAGWPAILAAAPGADWAAALAAPLDTSMHALLTNGLGTGWSSSLQTALGSNWAGALDGTLDSDAATVLGAMGTGWPATLAEAIASLRPTDAESSTSVTGVTSSTPAAGTPVVGLDFVAPPSGEVWISVSGYFEVTTNTESAVLGWELREGNVVGSGTPVQSLDDDYSLITGAAVNTSAPNNLAATRRKRWTGLTPGAPYNVRCMHYVTTGGTANFYYRSIAIEPIL